jgi:hypothetical protein
MAASGTETEALLLRFAHHHINPGLREHVAHPCTQIKPGEQKLTIVPKVTNPTKALGGNKLKLTTSVSLSAFNSSSSTQVSTT